MKIKVKTLKGSFFEIDVNPNDSITSVKKTIETTQGENVYPADFQMLIHQGKVLKDDTTLQDNEVAENSFVVIMLKKPKTSTSGASTATPVTAKGEVPAASSVSPNTPAPASAMPAAPAVTPSLATAATPTQTATTPVTTTSTEVDVYGQAASNLVAGNNFEQTIQQILDMGGGTWDRDMVVRALRAAFNNPDRAIDYLYSGIPEQAEVPPVARAPTTGQNVQAPQLAPTQAPQPPQSTIPSAGPNANPLDLFPQGLPSIGSDAGAGNLDFLRNSPQFRALQAMVQANPQILQPMLQELGKQNPQIMRLIQEHQAEFLQLINEPVEGGDNNLLGELGGAMPQTVTVTPEEGAAIERLEAMGFDRAHVLQVFFACDKNEEAAANYLLDNMHEFDE